MVSDQQKLYWNPEILKSQPEYGKMKRKCFNLTENLKYLIYNEFHIMQQNNNEYYLPLLSILFFFFFFMAITQTKHDCQPVVVSGYCLLSRLTSIHLNN